MMIILFILSAVAMFLGLMAFWLPKKAWKFFFSTGKMAHQASVGGALLFSGMFVGGLLIAFINLADTYVGWKSNDWEPVNAVVESSQIKKTSQPRSSGDAWVPEIRYAYVYNGASYTSGGIRFGSYESTDREWIDDQVNNRFAVGKELVVYVNPENPSQAVVIRGVDTFLFAYVLLGAVFMGIGAFYINELYHDWDGSKNAERMASPL